MKRIKIKYIVLVSATDIKQEPTSPLAASVSQLLYISCTIAMWLIRIRVLCSDPDPVVLSASGSGCFDLLRVPNNEQIRIRFLNLVESEFGLNIEFCHLKFTSMSKEGRNQLGSGSGSGFFFSKLVFLSREEKEELQKRRGKKPVATTGGKILVSIRRRTDNLLLIGQKT